MGDSAIRLRPLGGPLGAEVEGVDLSKPLEAGLFAEIRHAFLEHAVLVFRDQTLSHPDLIAFGRRFGPLDIHPIALGMEEYPEMIRVLKPAGEPASFGTSWHSDNSFLETPSQASILYGVTIPPEGGDTLWASMEAAYRALSPRLQAFLGGLSAVHSASRAYDPKNTGEAKYRGEAAIRYRFSEAIGREVVHPVIRTHPETGRRGLFVNSMFTLRIPELASSESDALLGFLYGNATRAEFTCRVRWTPGTLVMWDNRCTQHLALDDYGPFERLMYRVSVVGDRPV